jgi:predicted DCC family thiol-disulfide oxidoreductase YuxK
MSRAHPSGVFEVFYDGECPLCMREIRMLMRKTPAGRVRFTDIAAPDFDATALGITYEDLMAKIHGRMPDGRVVVGLEVFRQLYSAIGFTRLVAMSRWPGISHLLGVAYRAFAANRLRLTGRCNQQGCAVSSRHAHSPGHPAPGTDARARESRA